MEITNDYKTKNTISKYRETKKMGILTRMCYSFNDYGEIFRIPTSIVGKVSAKYMASLVDACKTDLVMEALKSGNGIVPVEKEIQFLYMLFSHECGVKLLNIFLKNRAENGCPFGSDFLLLNLSYDFHIFFIKQRIYSGMNHESAILTLSIDLGQIIEVEEMILERFAVPHSYIGKCMLLLFTFSSNIKLFNILENYCKVGETLIEVARESNFDDIVKYLEGNINKDC